MIRTAVISDCGLYRYQLDRVWDTALPVLAVLMLNPSTADGTTDDHTITKLIEFARRLGYGGFVVVNLFAFRATKPADMRAAADPVGPLNDHYIALALHRCPTLLCAWGTNGKNDPREADVRELLRMCGVHTFALRINADGTPAHPLMLPYSCKLERYDT